MIKILLGYRKHAMKFFSQHVEYNALVHVIGGIGLGIIIAPFAIPHPIRWACVLVGISLLGHLYTLSVKK